MGELVRFEVTRGFLDTFLFVLITGVSNTYYFIVFFFSFRLYHEQIYLFNCLNSAPSVSDTIQQTVMFKDCFF